MQLFSTPILSAHFPQFNPQLSWSEGWGGEVTGQLSKWRHLCAGACWLFKVAPSVHQMRAQDGGAQTESVLVFLQEGKRSNHQLQCVDAGGAPTPPRNSQTQARCPTIQLNSDAVYLEIASDSRGLRTQPSGLSPTSDA